MFFEGFTLEEIMIPAGTIRLRHGGAGPPLLLLHGNPQTHAIWHAVASELARYYHVVCPDLRGYGGSLKPEATADHAPYAKREMAVDMVAVMDHFSAETFFLAGHDRGGRVGHRLALDHPKRVRKLCVLDIVPTIEHFERTDMAFAMGYYHWFFLAQKHPFPEVIIDAAPEDWFWAQTSREPKSKDFFHADALTDYLAAVRTPEMIRGMCEDYRAAATIDLVHDRESRADGKKITCPLHVLWGTDGKMGEWYEPLELWKRYCDGEVTGGPLVSGHYLPEEAPDDVLAEFRRFFT